MKKVVLLAPYFLPRRRVGSWRPFKFAIHLKEYGWQPHIITIDEPRGSLTAKEQALLKGIPVYNIKSPFDLTHQLSAQLEYKSEKLSQRKSKPNPLLRKILSGIDQYFPIDSWILFFIFRRKKITNLVQKINPDVLWSTGDPWSSHWMAEKIVNTISIPWVADFRDPWTLGDVNLKKRADIAHRIDCKQEQKVLRKASVVTFTSNKTEHLYKEAYGRELISSATIYNSFDSALFNSKESPDKYFDEQYLNIVFFGKFRPLSPAAPAIEILEMLYQYHPETASKIRFHSFGELSYGDQKLAEEKGVIENFSTFAPIPLEEALPILTQADILWLSTHQDRENIIPAKLWDYLAAKRPIISVTPNAEIADILKQTGAGLQFSGNKKVYIVDMIKECLDAKEQHQPMPVTVRFDDEAIKQYDAVNATRKLAAIFDRLI